MTRGDNDQQIEALTARLSKLESRVWVLKQSALGALAVGALVGLLGAAAVTAPDVLSARSFQLVGDDGAVVGRWARGAGGAVRLEALDAGGEVIAGVQLEGAEPYARVIARGGKVSTATSSLGSTPEAGAGRAKNTDEAPKREEGEDEDDDAFDWVQ